MARKYPRFLFSDPKNTKSEGPFVVHTLAPPLVFKVNIHPNTVSLTLLDKETALTPFIQKDALNWLLNQIINEQIIIEDIEDDKILVKSGGSAFTKNQRTGEYEAVPEEKIKRLGEDFIKKAERHPDTVNFWFNPKPGALSELPTEELQNLKYLAHKGLPDDCIAGYGEIKFCPHRLGDGNKCKMCSDYV